MKTNHNTVTGTRIKPAMPILSRSIVSLILLMYSTRTSAQFTSLWQRQVGGPAMDRVFDMAVDKSGNSYTIGKFLSGGDFDPDPDKEFWMEPAGYQNLFIMKLNYKGDLVWAKQIKGDQYASTLGCSIKIDDNGNIYFSGLYARQADFDPGPGEYWSSSVQGFNGFLCKLNKVGDFLWMMQCQSVSSFSPVIDISKYGDIVMAGQYDGVAKFICSTSPDTVTIRATSGAETVYVMKLDHNGHISWTQSLGGHSAGSVKFDNKGDILITGDFYNAVLCKVGAQGNYIGSGCNFIGKYKNWGQGMTFDKAGNIYLIGTDVLPVGNNREVFILKADTQLHILWHKEMGRGFESEGWGIALDADENIYITGSFSDSIFFDSGHILVSQAQQDMFLCKMDNSGRVLELQSFGDIAQDQGNALAYVNGYLYLAGTIENGYADIVVEKFRVKQNEPQAVLVYPNPGNNILKLDNYSEGSWQIEVYNSKGIRLYNQSSELGQIEIDISGYESGMYYVILTDCNQKKVTCKIIKP